MFNLKKIFIFFSLIFCLNAAENKFGAYQPTYLLFGNKTDQIKTQFSFKYQFTTMFPLYIGYTQLMLWNAYNTDDSSPIRETNYNPEIFYRKDINFLFIKYIQLIPFEHKSNGQPVNDKDRTLDSSGFKLGYEFKTSYLNIEIDTKYYYLYNLGSKNDDIRHYMGSQEYRIALYPKFLKNQVTDCEEISVRFILGQQLYRNAFEYSFKIRIPFDIFSPYIYFQIWDGYGESLVDYNVRYTAYRGGLIFAN